MTKELQKAAAEGYNVELTKLVAETFSEHADKLPPEFKRDLFLDLADTLPAEVVFEAVAGAILKAAEFIGMLTGMDADKATYEATEAFVGELRARVKADAAKEDVEVEECNPEACAGCAEEVA